MVRTTHCHDAYSDTSATPPPRTARCIERGELRRAHCCPPSSGASRRRCERQRRLRRRRACGAANACSRQHKLAYADNAHQLEQPGDRCARSACAGQGAPLPPGVGQPRRRQPAWRGERKRGRRPDHCDATATCCQADLFSILCCRAASGACALPRKSRMDRPRPPRATRRMAGARHRLAGLHCYGRAVSLPPRDWRLRIQAAS